MQHIRGLRNFDQNNQEIAVHLIWNSTFGLIGFGGMIEDMCTAENLSAGLGIDEIIQGDQQVAVR